MSVNKEKIITLLSEIEKARKRLEEYRSVSSLTLLSSEEKLSCLKYLFIVLIEASVDLCHYLSARLFAETPESYSKCFAILEKHHVISDSLAKRMEEFAGFRNLLVHRYCKIDDLRVVERLDDLGTFHEFARSVLTTVEINQDGRKVHRV